MTMEIDGLYWNCDFGRGAWDSLLELALAFGWQPQGTIQIMVKDQVHMGIDMGSDAEMQKHAKYRGGGCYSSNDGYIVARADAAALGDALKKALADPEQKIAKERIAFTPCVERPDDFFSECDDTRLSIKTVYDLANLAQSGPFRNR